MVWCQWFGENMSIIDRCRILMKNMYIEGSGAKKNLLRNKGW